MKLRLAVLVVSLLVSQPAWAAAITLTLTNNAGEAVTSVTILPKGVVDAPAVSISGTAIAPGEAVEVSFESADDQCVYELTVNFASGKSSVMPDTDMCQTDGIVIQ